MSEAKLDFLPIEQVIFWLLYNGLDEVVFLADKVSLGNVLSSPLASSPVGCIPSTNQPIECSACFLQRSFIVRPMAENNIYIFKAESLQAVLHSLDHVLTGKTVGVGYSVFVGKV